MTPEHSAANLESWVKIRGFIEEYPEATWGEWQAMARRLIGWGAERGFDRYFRAGQSMSTFVFSTLDRHGLLYEPRVRVSLKPTGRVKLTYVAATPAGLGDRCLEYELDFDQAMPTLQRFLIHLWEVTMPEPVPEELRAPGHPFCAPVLMSAEDEMRWCRYDKGGRLSFFG